MKYLCPFLTLLFLCPLGWAAKQEIYGPTYGIVEKDLLQFIEQRLLELEKNGELKKLQQKMIMETKKTLYRPSSVVGIGNTAMARKWYFDPSITEDGETYNPLTEVSLDAPLLFFNGDDEKQVRWAKLQNKQGIFILVSGSPEEIAKELDHRVYFDQQGELVTRLSIKNVPAKVSQEALQLTIEEQVP